MSVYAEQGCPFYAGPSCPDCNGSCWEPVQPQPEWTVEDECEGRGHEYYGDHEGMGRCYCGAQQYPAGGAAA